MHRLDPIRYVALGLMWSGCTCSHEVTIAPPRVLQGGRAVSIAVSQSHPKRIVVATESGGLFRTFDGGASFQHLDAFPTFAPLDVAIASINPDVVIATARDDFRAVSGGGIWRSTDGGASWKRPAGWPPPSGPTCIERPEARSISHMPLSSTFYVATDCGIAVSADNGASFNMIVLDQFNPAVASVLVLNRTAGVAADNRRLWFLRGGAWQQASGGPTSGNNFVLHALASPWWATAAIFYHAGRDRKLWFSTDTGATWTEMATPPHGLGREVFVRAGRGLDGNSTHVDVYFGDGFALFRQAVTTAVPGGSNAWTKPASVDHTDPADVAFTPGFTEPLMLATDGGVHLTPDSGRTWKLTASGYGGFTALQIGEVTGRAVGGNKPHLDLYYGTHDNDIKGSADGGASWKGTICCEGAFLRADAASPDPGTSPVTGLAGGTPFLVPAEFGEVSNPAPPFPDAPDGNPANPAGVPFQVVGSTYLQGLANPGPPMSFDFFLTTDRGGTWTPAFALPLAPQGAMQFAGSLANPVAYVGVKRPSSITGLYRVQDATTQPVVRRADSIGINSLGVLLTGQARYAVFGVDPSNPAHLLAADVSDSTMKASVDGGIRWFPLPQLTTAAIDTGRFLFTRDVASFVTTIAWDPSNTCHILVGTMQNGVIRSTDGGTSWKRIAGSTVTTYVTSFFFPPSGPIWMSTYGRGLWTLSVDRAKPAGGRCAFPQPPGPHPLDDNPVAWALSAPGLRPFDGLRDTVVCATCAVVAVRNGWITDVTLDGNDVKALAVASGFVVAMDAPGKGISLAVPNVYRARPGPGLGAVVGRDVLAGRKVRALVLRGTQLVALVLSRDELPLPVTRTPMLYAANAGGSRVPGIVAAGDSVAVFGYGFLPGSGAQGVDIVMGQDTVAVGVEVRRDGTFVRRILVTRGPGTLVLTAAQRDGARLTVEQASLTVVAAERERSRR